MKINNLDHEMLPDLPEAAKAKGIDKNIRSNDKRKRRTLAGGPKRESERVNDESEEQRIV